MINNYLINNNQLRDERLFLDPDEEGKMVRIIPEQMIDDNLIPEIFSKIKDDLDQINFVPISEHLRQSKANSLEEIKKMTNNSKYFSQVEDIFKRETDSMDEYFNILEATMANKKMSILKAVSNGFDKMQEEKQILYQGMMDQNTPNVNMLNYVYDDEFVTLINNLSSAIKDFFKKSRNCFTTMKGISEHMIEHLLSSKSSVSETLVHLNSMMLTITPKLAKGNSKEPAGSTGKEKIVKDKINSLVEKLENLNETRVNFIKNLKSLELNSAKFYEDAKVIFKKMKETRSDKLEEYNLVSNSPGIFNYNQTLNWNNNMTSNFNQKDAEMAFNNFKHKSMGEFVMNQDNRMIPTSPIAGNRPVYNYATNVINFNNPDGINSSLKWKSLLEGIQQEEKIIGDKLESLKKRNIELTKEIEILKKRSTDLKLENISLKEKLQRSNSNYNSNYLSNQDAEGSSEAASKLKSASSNTRKQNDLENYTSEKNNSNINSDKRSINKLTGVSSSLKATPEKTKIGTNNNSNNPSSLINQNSQSNITNSKTTNVQISNGTLKSSTDNLLKPAYSEKHQSGISSIKTRTGSIDRRDNKSSERMTQDHHNPSCKPLGDQRLYKLEEKSLAAQVLNFMSLMTLLQENIAKKSPTVTDLKKEFELKKRELIKYAEKINSNSNKSENDTKSANDNYNSNSNINTNSSRLSKVHLNLPRNRSMLNSQNNSVLYDGNPENNNFNSNDPIGILNKTITNLKHEIYQMSKEIENLKENLLTEMNKNCELEKKIKEEKMMANLTKEKLNEEKEKNKNLELRVEQKDDKSSDKKSSLNLENKLNELNAKNKELLGLIKHSQDEIAQYEVKLKNSQDESESNKNKLNELLQDNQRLNSFKVNIESEISSNEKSSSSIRNEKDNILKLFNLSQTENSDLKTELSKLLAESKILQNENTNKKKESENLKKLCKSLEEEKLMLEGRVKICNEKLDLKEKEYQELHNKFTNSKEEISEISNNHKILTESLQKFEQENERFKELLQNDKSSLSKEIQRLLKENENLNEILTFVEKEKDNLIEEIKQSNEKLNTISKDKNDLEKNYSILLNQTKSLEEVKNSETTKYTTNEKNLKIQIDNLNEQINSKISEMTKLSSEKEKISEEKSLILRGVENLNMMIDTLNKEKAIYLNEIKSLKEEKEELVKQSSSPKSNYNSYAQKFNSNPPLSHTEQSNAPIPKFDSEKEIQRLKKEIEKLKNDIVDYTHMNDFLKKELSETNRLLNEQIISHKKDLNNSYMQNQEKNKEKLEDKELEIEKLNNKLEECNEKIQQFNSIFEEYKEEKLTLENLMEEKDEEIRRLNADLQMSIKESKEMKNRLAQFKMEFNSIIEDKERDIEKLRESCEIMSINEDKFEEFLKSLLLRLSAWEGSKLNVKKNYNMEEDNYDLIILMDEVSSEFEKMHDKLLDLLKRNGNDNSQIEVKLKDLNKDAEKKLNDFIEENKKLKLANEEYNKKILEVVNEKAPHLIEKESVKSAEDYLKTIELFKLYNEELNKINVLFEEKYTKALEKAKKYKQKLININKNNSVVSNINPNTHKILFDKIYKDLKWVLITEKSTVNDKIKFENTKWVKVRNNKIYDFNFSEFNQFKSENDKDKEISDLLSINNELILKLRQKEIEMVPLNSNQIKQAKNNNITSPPRSVSGNYPPSQVNNFGDINSLYVNNKLQDIEENYSRKLHENYISNRDFYTNVELIPYEKYQKILNELTYEREHNRQLILRIEKLENEGTRNIPDNNRSKIERPGNYSDIRMKEESSRFFDDESNINEMFLNNEIKISEATRRSIIRGDKNSEIVEKEILSPRFERKNSRESIKTITRKNDTQASILENVVKLEENEKLLSDQLLKIKEELKDTRHQRDVFKRKYEESITLQNGKKIEVVSMLKQAFEKLVYEISINNKTKEYVTVIMKILDYTESDINKILKKEKKGLFGIFTNANNTSSTSNNTNK